MLSRIGAEAIVIVGVALSSGYRVRDRTVPSRRADDHHRARAILRRRLPLSIRMRQTLHPDGKLQEQQWHNLHAAIRPLKVICPTTQTNVSVTLPREAIDTCIWEHDERRAHCF